MNERIYFISQFDNRTHNIFDWQHKIINEKEAYIGKDCQEEGFRVDEEVSLWTLDEIMDFYKI
jgi:hypothetical protein